MARSNRFSVLGSRISVTDPAKALSAVSDRVRAGSGGYICFSNVHAVVSGMDDERLREATNNAFMAMPDGKPISVVGRLRDGLPVYQVAGPDFMKQFLLSEPHLRHYFYGSTEETLTKLVESLKSECPEITISGVYSPPFRDLTSEEQEQILSDIKQHSPDVVWVGLGAPKQEYWMAEHAESLAPAVLLGVGAAFDFHAGTKRRAPEFFRKSGLEWLHRLASEPARLWKRYLVTNTWFIFSIFKEYFSTKFRIAR